MKLTKIGGDKTKIEKYFKQFDERVITVGALANKLRDIIKEKDKEIKKLKEDWKEEGEHFKKILSDNVDLKQQLKNCKQETAKKIFKLLDEYLTKCDKIIVPLLASHGLNDAFRKITPNYQEIQQKFTGGKCQEK